MRITSRKVPGPRAEYYEAACSLNILAIESLRRIQGQISYTMGILKQFIVPKEGPLVIVGQVCPKPFPMQPSQPMQLPKHKTLSFISVQLYHGRCVVSSSYYYILSPALRKLAVGSVSDIARGLRHQVSEAVSIVGLQLSSHRLLYPS